MTDGAQLTGVILAGGLGTRLRSVVSGQPKVLAEVAGRPFLGYLLDQLAGWGFSQVVLCTGYLGEQIEEEFGDRYGGLRIQYSREVTPLGTGGALRLAAGLIESSTVLVLNGDSYCDADLGGVHQAHQGRCAKATLLLTRVADASRFGRVQVDAMGRILNFDEKTSDSGPGLVNAGLYLIETSLLRDIPTEGPVSLERDVFPTWIAGQFYGYETSSAFLDIGTPESYAAAEAFLSDVSRRQTYLARRSEASGYPSSGPER
ncbi:nucleotidyltransferase family protein [Thioalkalicoccus limnaeus]|uniref:Nucleotidyltransferase family protein n=1 Tax=Thioalkalicoccus limnaeus TaxID=120681 RepID=A0ABV4BHJ1_9GAMM